MRERLESQTIVDGRYRVLTRIGSGGMADVYCAEDQQLGRKVALKVLYRRFAEDDEFVERFRREASSAAGLQHQHVVAVYDRGEWDGTYYIAMEFLEGRSLKAIVQQEAPLDPARAIDLTVQILRAARFAHRRGVIHRDLKPHNAIVDAEGRLKVTDFGIARAGASDMTQTGSIMGTAQYLSPEQAQGHAVSAASDLYSIGIILYELLTGRVPFEGESAVTIALKQVSERPVAPSAANGAVTRELDAIVMRALEKDPARRFADADEFIAALEQAKACLGSATAEPTTIAPVPVVPAAPAYDGYSYPAEPLSPAAERDGGARWGWWLLAVLLVAGAIVAAVLLFGQTEGRTVPSVVGADIASAEAKLRQEGFRVDTVGKTSADQPRDTVLGQDPSPGAEADEGSTVTLTVSTGPGEETVPGVEGLTRESARRRLTRAGFAIAERREFSDSVARDRVIRASPPEGTTLEKGRTVTLVLSRGKEQGAVPDVTGKSEDEARAELEGAGFRVVRRTEESADRDPGTVLSQDPAAGAKADKGSAVTITVAKEPETAEVPDVTGETRDDAIDRLQGDGFRIRLREQEVDSLEGDGVVLEQDPAEGEADKGSTVTLTVGKFNPDLNPDGETPPGGADGTGDPGAAAPTQQ